MFHRLVIRSVLLDFFISMDYDEYNRFGFLKLTDFDRDNRFLLSLSG